MTVHVVSPSVRRGRRQGRRHKSCPLSGANAPAVDYKNLRLLQNYLSERGKVIPCRLSSVSGKKQRQLAKAIKRARYLALLPYRLL